MCSSWGCHQRLVNLDTSQRPMPIRNLCLYKALCSCILCKAQSVQGQSLTGRPVQTLACKGAYNALLSLPSVWVFCMPLLQALVWALWVRCCLIWNPHLVVSFDCSIKRLQVMFLHKIFRVPGYYATICLESGQLQIGNLGMDQDFRYWLRVYLVDQTRWLRGMLLDSPLFPGLVQLSKKICCRGFSQTSLFWVCYPQNKYIKS